VQHLIRIIDKSDETICFSRLLYPSTYRCYKCNVWIEMVRMQ